MSGFNAPHVRTLPSATLIIASLALGSLIAVPESRAGAGDSSGLAVTGPVERPLGVAAARSTWTAGRMRAAVANAARRTPRRGRTRRRASLRWSSANPEAQQMSSDLPGTRAIGRLFFKRSDGVDSACSATLVNSANRSVVWTAGHCVHSGRGGGPHSDFGFVPSYRPAALGGPAPFGVWPAVRWGTTRTWARSGDRRHFRRDVGAVVLARDPHGRTLTDVLGVAQQIAFGRRPRRVASFGYPGLPPFTGELLYRCGPNPIGRVGGFPGRGFSPLAVACEHTAGASGGPWLVGADLATGIGTVVGATSVKVNGRPWLLASVLDREARSVYRKLSTAPN